MIIKENTFKDIAVTKGKINSTEDHLALKIPLSLCDYSK